MGEYREISGQSEEGRENIKQVFERYHKTLVRWCVYKLWKHRITPEQVSAEDLVQQVYLTLLSTDKTVNLDRPEHEVKEFLNRTLDTRISTYLFHKNRKIRKLPGEQVEIDARSSEEFDREFALSLGTIFQESPEMLERQELEFALGKLAEKKPEFADRIRKYYQEELTFDEIAKLHGITRQGVQSSVVRGLEMLQKIISRSGMMAGRRRK
ncbi:MAG: sigma-70 family RNA polymerase sigma factor [Candidatus Doudnabacteria bacterium]|nr:sigma-70 family RNA polymerase sigma factor [Candidatus Doudnabacteria bacterium]